MNFQGPDKKWIQNKIQKVLKKQDFWLNKSLKFECTKPKCFNYQVVANCKIYIKSHKYNLCNILNNIVDLPLIQKIEM